MLPLTTRLRRRVALAAAGTAVLVAVGGGTTAAFAAGSAPAAPAASTSCSPRLGAVLRAPEAALQADLKALRKDKKEDRADARRDIRTKLLSGAYGAQARRVAVIAAGPDAAPKKDVSLPAALKTDLKHLRTATKAKTDERKAAAAAIVKKAEAGSYGDVYQQRAKQLQDRCSAKSAK